MKLSQAEIAKLIDELAKSEKVTKEKLSKLSRELLDYIVTSADIGMVNRLLSVLTPMNKRTAVLFFKHFLPHEVAGETFGAMIKGQNKRQKRLDLISAFLADEGNDIWTWAAANVEVEAKKPDYRARITSAIKKALSSDDDEVKLTPKDILACVKDGGVTVTDMLALVNDLVASVADKPAGEVVEGEFTGDKTGSTVADTTADKMAASKAA